MPESSTDKPNKPIRPLPSLAESDTATFWKATANSEFKYQQCTNCATLIWYPRQHCTGCVEGALEWKTSKGEGVIYSFSIVRQSYHPFFRSQVPYAVALVDLDEGPRFLTNVTGVDDPTTQVHIGQRVSIAWEPHEGLQVPLVAPLASTA